MSSGRKLVWIANWIQRLLSAPLSQDQARAAREGCDRAGQREIGTGIGYTPEQARINLGAVARVNPVFS
jgi:hypothetical protein